MSNKQSTDRSLCAWEINYKKLTWLSKTTSHTLFIRIKVSVLLSTEIVSDPDNSPDIPRRPFGEVVKPEIALARFKSIEPRKFLWSGRFRLSLGEEDKKAYHLSSPIR